MITRWQVPILGIEPRHTKFDYLHALVCEWLDQRSDRPTSPGETDGQRHDAATKYRAIGGFDVIDGVPALEITTFSDEAADRLWEQAYANRPVRLGSQDGIIAAEPHPADYMDWQALAEPDQATSWQVEYLTPTGFRNGDTFSPWLDPARIARSMTQRWNTLADPDLAFEPLTHEQAATLWVSDIGGTSRAFHMGGHLVSGFTGQINYAGHDLAVAQQFGALLRFGEWAGIGAYTAWGLGRARLFRELHTKNRAAHRTQSDKENWSEQHGSARRRSTRRQGASSRAAGRTPDVLSL